MALLVVAGLTLAAADASAWWNTNWSHRRKLTFANPRVENLSGFQVLIRLNSTRIDYAKTRGDGFDLRFVDSNDATLLDYEIETWDEAGTSWVWVRVPQVDLSSNTDFIWMYYGNPSAPNVQNAAAVWLGYSMVQHFEEPSPSQHLDSTANLNNSTSIDVQTQASPLGFTGPADVYDDASADNVDVPDAGSLDMAAGDSFVVEAWINTGNAGDQMVVSKEAPGVGEIQLWTTGTQASFWLNDGVTPSRAYGTTNITTGGISGWHYLVGRWNEAAATVEIFVNGVSEGSDSDALGAIGTASPLVIGQEGDPDRGFNFAGRIDEVRVWKTGGTGRSGLWIDAQYDSMRDTGVGLVGTFVTYGLEAAQCCGLGVTEAGGMITVDAPNRFRLRFNQATGAGIDEFFDTEESFATDLAGGTAASLQPTLLSDEVGIAGASLTTGANTQGAELDLLEATPARVKVRQEAFYQQAASSNIAAGVKSHGDYSIYGIGRLALGVERRATVAQATTSEQLQLSVHYQAAAPLNVWTGYSQTAGPFASVFAGQTGAAADDFVLAQIEQPSARTDFLTILSQDWADASRSTFFSAIAGQEWEELSWIDNDGTAMAVGSQRWNFLTYFKPTTIANNADAQAITRATDYRAPAVTVVGPGAGWVAADEYTNADPANVFFNEAEAAYVFDLDPAVGQGLTLSMDGATATRYRPFFKIRRWRSFVEAPVVSFDADGPGGAAPVALVKNVDYRAAVKPFSRAHRTNTLDWHCTLQDASACTVPNLDIGTQGSITGGTVVPGRFGSGLSIASGTDVIQASTSDFNNGAGAVEFWYRPAYDSTAGGAHMLWWNRGTTANYDCYRFEHTGGQLVFQMVNNAASLDCVAAGATGDVRTVTVPGTSYSWLANEWVHLRTEWNLSTGLRVLVNGRLVGSSAGYTLSLFQAGQTYIGSCSDVAALTCPGAGGARHADGIIDEPAIYEGLGGLGNPESLAHAGLVADATEYLARADLDSALLTTPVASGDKGVYIFFGADSKFSAVNMTFETLGVGASVGAGALVWEYWSDNGAGTEGWLSLESVAGFIDGTNDFKQRGAISWNPAAAPLANWKPYSVNGGPELYYVRVHLGGAGAYATTPVENVVKTDILLFQYCKDVTAANQIFAFSVPTTEVKLQSFSATAGDASVLLEWRTASELDNLGFHLHRTLDANGPWTRLTTSLVPGLGSSAIGQAYSFQDTGLQNGTAYYYRLDDVDASSKVTSHGPVSAVPQAGSSKGSEPSNNGSTGRNAKKTAAPSCPEWVLGAYASATGSDPQVQSLRCTRHGDPETVSLREVSRDSRQATLELRTGGFYALHTQSGAGEPSGSVRVFVPGFDFPQDDKAAALPTRRALADAVVGRSVRLGGVRALELQSFALSPSALGKAEMQVGRDGTVRALRRGQERRGETRGAKRFPRAELATLLPSLFQGEKKSAAVEIAPLRYDEQRRRLVLAKRVLVKLLFTGREPGESGRGSLGRAPRRKPVSAATREVLARLFTTSRGLHAATFEQLFPGRTRGFALSELRLERQGAAVGFHAEPAGNGFGPGGKLYFHAERTTGSTEYSGELAWELLHAQGGVAMPLQSAAPGSAAVTTDSVVTRTFETNRFYQPGLLEAPDLWLWEAVASGATRVKSFTLAGISTSGTATLDVYFQGASESGQALDHHVSVSLNGTLVGEARFAGKKAHLVSFSMPSSLLREGSNDLSLTSVADTGVSSLVFLDRFDVTHAQPSTLTGGLFEGTWTESGTASVAGVVGPVAALDVTGASSASGAANSLRWLSGYQRLGDGVRFEAEAGHRYIVASQPLAPRVAAPEPEALRAATNQADYVLIAPRGFLDAAQPLLDRRESQGLATRAVAFEAIAAEFGHGQASAEAIKGFIAHAFHSWAQPSPRYVVLLGDASYDPRNFTGSAQPAPLPALWTKTSYLWTASDPELAAVNGEDGLPDLAIGRLPATTFEQAQALVAKLLAWEDSGQGLLGGAALVADNPDVAGDFEADVEDIRASYLASRDARVLKLSELGAQTRPSILDALNSGLSYLNYVGHGGAAVWASENVWNTWDAPSLQEQSQQPLLLTMNCLNGYFVAPTFESLSESLVKAEGRGAIASFSPSGLSLDGPAHQYHRALMAELTSGRHERLGDAIAAAQRTYAESGLMPELVAVYQLLGDPAMRLR